jgi:predicted transcriptional regulator
MRDPGTRSAVQAPQRPFSPSWTLQPEDSSREEIVRDLAFHTMVERGLADADAKRSLSNEEMGRRIRSWQQ